MKKYLVIIAVAMLGISSAFAQFSAKVGYEYSKTHTKTYRDKDSDPCSGYFVEGDYSISLDRVCHGLGIDVGLGFLYEASSDKYQEDLLGLGVDFDCKEEWKASYIQIPILATYTWDFGNTAVKGLLGFNPSIGLSAKSKFSFESDAFGYKESHDYDCYGDGWGIQNSLTGEESIAKLKRLNWFGQAGAEVIFQGKYLVKAVYFEQLNDGSDSDHYSTRSRGFNLGVGYVF